MSPQRRPDSSSLAEVLDRVLDKGVVIDVWARISVVGIELLTIEARVVVASVDTFLHYAEEIAKIEQATAEGTSKSSRSKSDQNPRHSPPPSNPTWVDNPLSVAVTEGATLIHLRDFDGRNFIIIFTPDAVVAGRHEDCPQLRANELTCAASEVPVRIFAERWARIHPRVKINPL